MTYMEAYVSDWQVIPLPRGPKWYPLHAKKIERQIIEEAYLAGFSVKEIAYYFRRTPYQIYEKISVRDLKKER